MLGVQRVAIWFGLVVGILVGMLVAVNLVDEPLKPEVRALLESENEVSPAAVSGFKYSLALRVPADQDPAAKGEEIYKRMQLASAERTVPTVKPEERSLAVDDSDNPCKDKLYCYKAIFEKEGPAVASFLKKNEIPLQRFDRLIHLGEMASDLSPDLLNLANQEAALLEFSRVKYVDLSSRLHERRVEEVAKEIKAINLFVKKSFGYQQSMLDTAAMVEVFKTNRDFFTVASRGYPELRAAMGDDGLESFKLDIDFDALVAKATAVEFKAISGLLREPMNPRAFELASLPADAARVPARSGWKDRLLEPVMATFLKPNETLNSLYSTYTEIRSPACMSSEVACRDEVRGSALGYLINPFGKSYLEIFRPRSAYFKMLKEKVAGLNSPVES